MNAGESKRINTMAEMYLDVSARIAALEKTKEGLKAQLMQHAGAETNKYEINVTKVEQNRTVSAPELLEALGPVVVVEKGLIKTSSYDKLSVKAKK